MMCFRTKKVCSTFIASLFSVAASGEEPSPPSARGIDWITTFEQAQANAKKENKILLADFYADWCGPCRLMDRYTFTDPRVIKLANEGFVCVKVDIDRNRRLAAQFRITSIPTIIFFSSGGEMIERRGGMLTAAAFVQVMNRVLSETQRVRELEKKVQANPQDIEAALKLSTAYVKHRRYEEAARLLAIVEKTMSDQRVESNGTIESRRERMLENYTAIGEGYLEQGKAEEAIAVSRRTLASARSVDRVVRLRGTLINAYLASGDHHRAAEELKALIAWKDVPGALKGRAQVLLARLNAQDNTAQDNQGRRE